MRRLQHNLNLALALAGCVLAIQTAQSAPGQLSQDYFNLLRNGDAAKLGDLLERGASANARDEAGNTALMQATAYADLRSMRLLVEHGAEVNATNLDGANALMRAAADDDKLAFLLDKGADVRSRSALGNTVLMLAARPADSHHAVALLLAHGADPKATNHWGATALMAAAAGGDLESARLLIEHGAEVNAQPVPDRAGFIFGGGRSALTWAAYRGNVAMVKLLLDHGADVNAPAMLGTALAQAAWADRFEAAQLLLDRGAKVNQVSPSDGYMALHWAASTEGNDPKLVNLLLAHGADANFGGGEDVEAFMGTLQTPLMLARRRGNAAVLAALEQAGATNATPDPVRPAAAPRKLPAPLDSDAIRAAINRALPPLQVTSLESKKAFVRHASHQDCTSCHQQFLPMTALGLAKKQQASINPGAEQQLIAMVRHGDLRVEMGWQALFHPEPVHSVGYMLLAEAAEELPADASTDAWVYHLSVIQGAEGEWYNNLPRPPIQTGDIGATALAIHALQRYPLPGHKAQFTRQVDHARQWLWNAKPENTEGRVYQLLGLAWAGEPAAKLSELAHALVGEQRADGGWAQLPGMASDPYATGQTIYALRVAAGVKKSNPAMDRGLQYLLATQLDDGTWYVRRRAFPFQPTMTSGFPHGRDSWISAAASSWAIMALSLPEEAENLALSQ
jgi:ankyrin repeat protein